MKRTKRYGGFVVGDRVRPKHKMYDSVGIGEVVGMTDGKLIVLFIVPSNGWMEEGKFKSAFMPNQLVNLTRIEEENKKITDPMPPKADFNLAKEIDELKAIRGFVAEALRQTEIFLSPLTPCGDSLPSPYTRDIYTTTKDYE